MQFEEFDRRTREAADQHHPVYNEKAWDKMEQLLDVHMPQHTRNRRRFIFWFFLALLIAGGTWIFLGNPLTNTKSLSKSGEDQNIHPPSERIVAGEKQAVTHSNRDNLNNTPGDNDQLQSPHLQKPGIKLLIDNQAAPGDRGQQQRDSKQSSYDKQIASKGGAKDQLDVLVTNGDKGKKKNQVENQDLVSTSPELPTTPVAIADNSSPGKPAIVENKKQDPQIDSSSKEITTPGKKVQKSKNTFFISLSAGPDISKVGNGTGKMKLLTGAGIGYTFGNRLSIRTGVYLADKVYTAAPKDYKPTTPVPNQLYLTRIEAACKVIEVPLNLSFNFSRSERRQVFASAGLLSYFMKKESYDYVYEYPGTPAYTYNWTVKNKNNHYFSVLTVSGGYQQQVSRSLSLAAEPYIKLPLAGVGVGKVRLNSAGVMLSAIVRPFHAAKQK